MVELIHNKQELEFAVFCIENTAIKLNMTADKMYKLLSEKSDILQKYIVPNYESLHTQSKEYIVNDILDIMGEKGLIC